MEKKKIITIIAGIVIAVMLLAGGLFYWFTRPIYKINKAIERNDLETVSDLYYQLNDKDKEAVSDEMRLYCQTLSASYLDGNIDYETVKAQFDILGEEVLFGDADFDGMYSSINILHTSREALAAGNAAFEAKDYEKALAEYEKVLGSDDDYEKVKENMETCRHELLPDFVGVWENTIDLGYFIAASLGMAGDDRFSFEMTSYYEFNADGTGLKYTDTEKLEETLDQFMDLVIDIVMTQYEKQYGVTRSQLEKEFKKQYGMSMSDYVKKNANIENTLTELDAERQEFTYELDGDTIHVTGTDGTTINFERDGDELLLSPEGHEDHFSIYKQYNIEMPLHFKKVD